MNTFSEDRNCFLWVVNVVVLSISLVVLERLLSVAPLQFTNIMNLNPAGVKPPLSTTCLVEVCDVTTVPAGSNIP